MSDLVKRIQSACPCCGFVTLDGEAAYEICPVCFWEDDPVQKEDPSYTGGANRVSLFQARKNFSRSGACDPDLVDRTRPPRLEEIPVLHSLSHLEQDQRREAVRLRKAQMVAVLGAMRSGSIPALDGCGVVVMLECGLSESEMQTDLVSFLAIYGEVEDYPRGTVRQHWSPDALAQKDADWREYESRMHDRIITLAGQAEGSLRNELKST